MKLGRSLNDDAREKFYMKKFPLYASFDARAKTFMESMMGMMLNRARESEDYFSAYRKSEKLERRISKLEMFFSDEDSALLYGVSMTIVPIIINIMMGFSGKFCRTEPLRGYYVFFSIVGGVALIVSYFPLEFLVRKFREKIGHKNRLKDEEFRKSWFLGPAMNFSVFPANPRTYVIDDYFNESFTLKAIKWLEDNE